MRAIVWASRISSVALGEATLAMTAKRRRPGLTSPKEFESLVSNSQLALQDPSLQKLSSRAL